MNNPIFSWFTAMVLLSGSDFLASAAAPAAQTQPSAPATAPVPTAKLPFATPLQR